MAKKKEDKVDLLQVQNEIERLAYEIYEMRKKNNEPGDEIADYFKASNEIKKKYGIKE
jgi:cell division protein FtsL